MKYLFIFTFCVALVLRLGVPLAFAQDTPSVEILSVDTSKFPDVTVTVETAHLGGTINSLLLAVEEDGVQQKSDPPAQTGATHARVALLLDLSTYGADKIPMVRGNLVNLINLNLFGVDDEMTVFAPGPDGKTLVVVSEWTNNLGDLINKNFSDNPFQPEATNQTALKNLVNAILEKFTADPTTANELIVFSDGTDQLSDVVIEQIMQTADTNKVRIHTVLLPANAQDINTLQAISSAGPRQGKYIQWENDESLNDLWRLITDRTTQWTLHYRSQQTDPHSISVKAITEEGRPLAENTVSISRTVPPPVVTITSPRQGEPVTGTAIVMVYNVQWADGAMYKVQSVECQMRNEETGDVREGRMQNSQCSFSLKNLPTGSYALSVQVTDELLHPSNTAEITGLNIVGPEQPTPSWLQWILIGAIVLAVISLAVAGYAVYLLITDRDRLRRQGASVAERVSKTTRRIFGNESSKPAAKLAWVAGGQGLPDVINLDVPGGITKIGRADDKIVDRQLNDLDISNHHCTITQMDSGKYFIEDHNSTNHTWVNDKQLHPDEKFLLSKDVQIKLGPHIIYRFVPPAPATKPMGQSSSSVGGTTRRIMPNRSETTPPQQPIGPRADKTTVKNGGKTPKI